jgi:thioredoxin reductase
LIYGPAISGRWRGHRISSKRVVLAEFAVDDVRGGNIKRIASAVGEGSIAIAFVRQVLHE